MRTLKWSKSHVVFVSEMDDQHKEIFQSLSALETALSSRTPPSETGRLVQAPFHAVRLPSFPVSEGPLDRNSGVPSSRFLSRARW